MYSRAGYDYKKYLKKVDGEYLVDVSQNITLKDIVSRLSPDERDSYLHGEEFYEGEDGSEFENEEYGDPQTLADLESYYSEMKERISARLNKEKSSSKNEHLAAVESSDPNAEIKD